MSLLLDALKQAELAKAQGAKGAEPDRREPRMDRGPATAPGGTDTEPLDLTADAIMGGPATAPGMLPDPAGPDHDPRGPEPTAATNRREPTEAQLRQEQNASQQAAARLFSAKRDGMPSRRRAGLIAMVGLGVVALTMGGLYLRYILLQPLPTLAPTGQMPVPTQAQPSVAVAKGGVQPPVPAPRSPTDTGITPAPAAPAAAPASGGAPLAEPGPAATAPKIAAADPTAPPAPVRAPGTPGYRDNGLGRPSDPGLAAPARMEPPAIAARTAPVPRSDSPALARSPRPASRPPVLLPRSVNPSARLPDPGHAQVLLQTTGADSIRLRSGGTVDTVDPGLDAAYRALATGDYATARKLYVEASRSDPTSVDAWLGLATLSAADGDSGGAQRYYQRALELEPGNGTALAGITALKGSAISLSDQSMVKSRLAGRPSAPLYFALGNSYAGESRWAEAQQAYFDAFRLDSGNPDYAFNLAVALDQLDQSRQALEYYQKARTLARGQAAHFDIPAVIARIGELGGQ